HQTIFPSLILVAIADENGCHFEPFCVRLSPITEPPCRGAVQGGSDRGRSFELEEQPLQCPQSPPRTPIPRSGYPGDRRSVILSRSPVHVLDPCRMPTSRRLSDSSWRPWAGSPVEHLDRPRRRDP